MSKDLNEARQLFAAGRYLDAASVLKKVVRKTGSTTAREFLATCYFNQGVMMLAPGLFDEAEALFRESLEAYPRQINALINLGNIMDRKGDAPASVDCYEKALAIEPAHVMALENLARAYAKAGRLDDADATLQRLAQGQPQNGIYPLERASLVASIIPERGYPHAVRARIAQTLEAFIASPQPVERPEQMQSTYFYLSYHGLVNRDINRLRAEALLRACPALAWRAPHITEPSPLRAGGRIRIGIASRFFREHSIGNTSIGLVEKLDRSKFEVVVIHIGNARKDRMKERFDASADEVRHVRDDDLDAARKDIAALRLDILFWQDIGMESFSYFLAFARLAPVQLTSYGHPDTTGIPAIDYFLSSDLYEPEDGASHYSEKLVCLKNAGNLSYYQRPVLPQRRDRESFGLGSHRVYLCPQALFKVHPDMDTIFSSIVAQDDKAVIVLIEPAERVMREALEKRIKTYHPHVLPRLRFMKQMPKPEYLALLGCADVMLDTVHFNGMNTNLEAYTAGVPVVTLPGAFHRSRHTYGMYRAMGFMDLVASDLDDYATKAVKVANDSTFREYCIGRIRESSDVLFESELFIRECEAALVQIMKDRARPVPGVARIGEGG